MGRPPSAPRRVPWSRAPAPTVPAPVTPARGLSCSDVRVTVDSPTGALTILEGVTCDFTAPRTAVIGLNGSGKSTLLRLFNALVTPASGTVRVNGIDPAAAPRRARAEVGFVFTDPAAQILMPTPLEDVELSLRRTVTDREDRARRALDWLERTGVGHRAHHSVFDLSGGERQLVALAAVLAAQPRVLVLDEPTTLLDLRNRIRLTELLDSLDQQQVISTHDLDLAATARHVLVVHAGRVLARGEPAETIARYRHWCAHGFPAPEPA